jgi:hypothetical protein
VVQSLLRNLLSRNLQNKKILILLQQLQMVIHLHLLRSLKEKMI